MCISVYPKFLAKEGTCKGDARYGMHAVPRVTSVIPGACKYKPPPFGTESLCVEGMTSAGYPDSSLKPLGVFA